MSGDPPSGSFQDPTIVPPCFSTRPTTSRSGSAETSSLQSSASNPLVFGFALRDARFFLATVLGGISVESNAAGYFMVSSPPMFLSLAPLRKHRDYRLLYTGQLISMFGSMITYVAVPYQVFAITHSSLVVGMLGAAQLVPLLLFALWGGAYADAMDRRRLLVISELFLTAGSLFLAINALLPHPSVSLIFIVSAAMSACNGFHRPALDALTPRLVEREDLTAVSALISLRMSLSAIVGPALGGVCIAALGFPMTYMLDVLSFLVSLVSLAMIRSMPAR